MAESTDKKTRKIAEKRIEPGKEFEGYQEAQNQLLAIQAEQQQNLALQANDAMNVQQQNQTLAQAAEVMAMDNLNPATQGMLAGYGLNQPRVIKQSNTQRQGPNNITINNTTINNASGPVQGREISIRPQEAGQSRFKAWLTNVFARQDAQWQKQNQEYTRRESSLTRNSNKMMRKLEGLGKEIGSAVDPRKVANKVSNPLMNLLKSIGLIALAKRLPKILRFIDNAETIVKGWFNGIGDKIREGISNVFNVDLDTDEGLLAGIRNIFYNKNEDGVINKLIKWIDETLIARKRVADNAVDLNDVSGIDVVGAIQKLSLWLSTFLGGTEAAKRVINFQENANQQQNVKRRNTQKVKDGFEPGIRSDESETNESVIAQLGKFRTSDLKIQTSLSSNTYLQSRRGTIVVTPDKEGNQLTDQQLTANYETYRKTDNSENSKLNFLNQAGAVYLGEGAILTQETKKIVEAGQYHFDDSYLCSYDMNRLRNNNWYAPLSLELQFISDTKKRRIEVPYLIWYLTVLRNTIRYGGSVPVWREFIKLLSNNPSFDITTWAKDNNIETKEFVLLVEPMVDEDRRNLQFRVSNDDRIKGFDELKLKTLPNYLDNYLKLMPKEKATNKRKPIPLPIPDRDGHTGTKRWSFYMLNIHGLTNLLTDSLGTAEINYKSSVQQSLVNSLKKNITNPENRNFKIKTSTKDYEQRWDNLESIEREHASRIAELDLEEDLEKLGKIKYNSSSTYNIRDTKASITPKGSVDDIQYINISAEQKRKNMEEVYNFFKSKGFSDEQIAGIMGVLGVESAGTFDPRIVNVSGLKKGGINGTGEGIAQWVGGRKTLFKKWWKDQHPGEEWNGVRNTSLQDQLNYLMHEWKTRHKYSYDEIKKLKNDKSLTPAEIIEKTTDYFTRGFENGNNTSLADYGVWGGGPGSSYEHPYSKALKIRLNNASGIYNSFIKKGKPTTTTQGSTTTAANMQNDSGNQPSSTVADNVIDNTTTVTPVITPTIETPTNTQIIPQSLAIAETIEHNPQTQVSHNQSNTAELEYLSLIAQSTDYTARALTPLFNNMNSGFSMVAQSGKSTPAKTRANTLNTENEGIV